MSNPKSRHCTPSPDIKEFLEDEESDGDEPPILINVPQLSGPLAFSKEALQTWGHAHLDHSEQSI